MNRRTAALALALVLPMSACGTRMSADRIAAADGTALQTAAVSTDASSSPGDDISHDSGGPVPNNHGGCHLPWLPINHNGCHPQRLASNHSG